MPQPLPRSKVKRQQTWNAESLFASPAAFEAEAERLLKSLPAVTRFKGRLATGPDTFMKAMAAWDAVLARASRLRIYATMSHAVDTTNEAAASMSGRAQSVLAKVAAAGSFIEPELTALGAARLRRWLATHRRVGRYEQFLNDIIRRQSHIRSGEVEELLAMLNDPFAGTSRTASVLANADFRFEPARTAAGRRLELTQSTLDAILARGDRTARATAWNNYHDQYFAFRNTLAANLSTSIRQNVFLARARGFESSLSATLFGDDIPEALFHNLLAIFRKNLPLWHRYWKIRRTALGVKRLEAYDVWAPLTTRRIDVPFERAVNWICDGLGAIGDDYVDAMRRGCLEQRWVDWSPNRGKRHGAFSVRAPRGVHPFVNMSYTDDVGSMSTLSHELGHSMHFYHAARAQRIIYTYFPSIVAETASNTHQALTRAHLLRTRADAHFQIKVLEEALDNFHRYFFIMPTLARFELETHRRVEQGHPLTADGLIELMCDLFAEGFGGEMHLDRQRVGMIWGTFTTHLYIDYYTFQYAIGISAAHAIAKRILDGTKGAAQDYIRFLQAGSSRSPMDVFKIAGVDMQSTRPIEDAFAVLGDYIDRLGELTGARRLRQA